MAGLNGGTWWTGRPSTPSPQPGLDVWPRVGCTIHQFIYQPEWDVLTFAKRMQDRFGNRWCADVNLLSAPWSDGMLWPWQREPDGRWDFRRKNQTWLDRARFVRDTLNGYGGLMKGIGLELYSFSERKAVPFDQDKAWPRWNVNDVYWPPTDYTLTTLLPDWVLEDFFGWCLPALAGPGFTLQLALEMPEKPLHARLRDLVRRLVPGLPVVVNRNEDTPGQYQNMKIGQDYDRIEFHGWKTLAAIDKRYPYKDPKTGTVYQPTIPETFRQFFDNRAWDGRAIGMDASRVIASSDGARKSGAAGLDPVNPYDWQGLLTVADFVMGKGGSYVHQSRAKLSPPSALNVEWEFLEDLAQIARRHGVIT